ncbi:AP-3 complex subunit mu [Linum perenne]
MDLNAPPEENYANPRTCLFHVLFKAASLAFYILSALFINNFVIIFVVTVLLAALDFWVVKNVSGRILVGLRWWNEINDLGESVWRFESLDQESLARMNKKDAWLFWWTIYLTAVAWVFLGIFSVIRFQADYCLITGVCVTLSVANIIGFTKCRKGEYPTIREEAASAVCNCDDYISSIVNHTISIQCCVMRSLEFWKKLNFETTSFRPERLPSLALKQNRLQIPVLHSALERNFVSILLDNTRSIVSDRQTQTQKHAAVYLPPLRFRVILNFPDFIHSQEVMLEKQLTGNRVDRSICAWFWDQLLSEGDSFKQQPVIASPTHYLFQVVREGITFLACTQVEMPPLMAIEFLGRVADVLSDYLEGLNEDVLKDNFIIVYELLDEMIDNGFPLTTEPNILREMIAPPNIVSKMLSVVTGNSSNVSETLPGATSSCVPWRTTDIKYANNEVYVDLVEEMDAIINRDGVLVKCEVFGEVQVNSHITGVPDLSLSFINPSILDDVRFHPSVRYRPWEANQILSFVPPDGQFKLMSYRIRKLKSIPLYVKPQITSDGGSCRISVMVGIRNDPGKAIDSISVQFQLPSCVLSADLTANHGVVNVLSNKTCVWSIDRIPKDRAPSLSGTFVLENGLERLHVFPTFQVGFRIQGVALSGLQIDRLELKVIPNRLYKGFRALTRGGRYEVRS